MSRLHADEIPIDIALVRRLVDRGFPEFVHEGLRPVLDSGSSNALFRLGNDKLVRLPRQTGGSATIDKEAHWLPYVAARVGVEVPMLVGVGEPDVDYPERWAITTWIPGTRPTTPGSGRADTAMDQLAEDLARFLTELRAMDLPAHAEEDKALSWYRESDASYSRPWSL